MVTIITDSDLQFNTKNLLTQLKLVVKELAIKGDLTIKLGGEAESQSLNSQYRGKNYPTDVLSFLKITRRDITWETFLSAILLPWNKPAKIPMAWIRSCLRL